MSVPATGVAGPGFTCVRCATVKSLNVEFAEYLHPRTGARHVHLAAEDSNNAFMVAFPTVPRDSTGVAHILEHTTLCGSRRYPVRDPFFNMLRRSLNTFMNAFTGADMTAYPFATQNRRDFDNLLSVYLDATFFPRLDPLDFAQEGHRLELASADDPDGPVVWKGVVYNEMKGAMSSPTAQLWQALAERLFPTTTYRYNSGGDPRVIPSLTYEQLRDFHARHYHPSNAVFFTYGDFPVEEHQARIEEWALSQFEARAIDLAIPDERRLERPVRAELPYAVDLADGTTERTHVVLGWLLGRSNDVREMMAMRLLDAVLLQNSASPLRQALETTALGKAPSELCGLDDTPREAVFMCGLEGSEPDRADAVESMILDVLAGVARDGVPRADVEAALHQMELSQREISSRYPYGLQLMNRMLPSVVHGGDPLHDLDIDPVLEDLRAAIADPRFVADLARRALLGNPHRVRITLRPDTGLAAREQADEEARLAAVAAGLDREARIALAGRARALQARQQQEDDPDLLPRLTLADVPTDIRVPAGTVRAGRGGPVWTWAAGTNGLVHAQVVVPLPALAPEELPLLGLYWSVVTELGCGADDYLAMQARQTRTGHFSASLSLRGAIADATRCDARFIVAGEGLARNRDGIVELLHTLFDDVRFDEIERLRDLVAQLRADAEEAVAMRGHTLAALASARGIGPVAAMFHCWNGLAAVQMLRRLDRELEDDAAAQALGASLAGIHSRLRAAPREHVVVGERDQLDPVAAAIDARWEAAGAAGAPFVASHVPARIAEAWTANTQVNFCARAYPAVAAAHPDAAACYVLSHLLRDGFLHRAIREQGGAYGGGASYDADSGSFRFYSYRDPRLAGTLADFERSLEWVQEAQPARRIEEAVLSAIKDIDQPSSPAGECLRAFFDARSGRTPEFRREFRARVLAATAGDLQRVAATYLRPEQASTVVIGGRETLAGAGDLGLEPCTL